MQRTLGGDMPAEERRAADAIRHTIQDVLA
jgi:hypothetical protein